MLVRYLDGHPSKNPSSSDVQLLFRSYQDSGEKCVRMAYSVAYSSTRLGSWDTLWKKLLAQHHLPWEDDVAAVSTLIEEAVKASFLPLPSRVRGFVEPSVLEPPTAHTKILSSCWSTASIVLDLIRIAASVMVERLGAV